MTSPFQHIVTYCTWFYRYLYCYNTVHCFPANVTLLLRLNDKFDGIWTSGGLRPRFRCGYGDFGFYNHSDIMTKMVWSQGGHIKRRLHYMDNTNLSSFADSIQTYPPCKNNNHHGDIRVHATP